MRFDDVARAVYAEIDRHNYAAAMDMIDSFLTEAAAPELAMALDLKALLLWRRDPRNLPAALALLEKACSMTNDPGTQAHLLVHLLSTYRMMGEVDRASQYEPVALIVLKQHSDNPHVQRYRALLTQCCGRIAQLRGERALALWYFLRAEEAYQATTPEDAKDWACYRAGNFVNLFEEYTSLHRLSDAREALTAAREVCPRDRPVSLSNVAEHEVKWGILTHDLGHATEWLLVLAQCYDKARSPDLETRLLIQRARLAVLQGDAAQFHRILAEARSTAVTHCLDDLLGEIQRLQRAPRLAT